MAFRRHKRRKLMQDRCETCCSWKPDEDGRFGSCSSLPKKPSAKPADVDELIVTDRAATVTIKVGRAFGCVRWKSRFVSTEVVADLPPMSADDLRKLLARHGMTPADLSRRLGVRTQRACEWERGTRKVPRIAVELMKLKGLI
jgi:hypothetical protein